MQIEKNKVVNFHYHLTDAEAGAKETSTGGEAVSYLHGYGNLLEGLEKELQGKRAGDKFSITLAPEQAYGPRREGAVQRIPIKHLEYTGKLRSGMVVEVESRDGWHQVTVIKVGKFNADVDLNHPMAGRTLMFDIEVLEVREATAEELAHGHVHGPGGHEH